jgi:hypothetical protein
MRDAARTRLASRKGILSYSQGLIEVENVYRSPPHRGGESTRVLVYLITLPQPKTETAREPGGQRKYSYNYYIHVFSVRISTYSTCNAARRGDGQ